MVSVRGWQPKLVGSLLQEEDQKEEKLFLPKIKWLSLKVKKKATSLEKLLKKKNFIQITFPYLLPKTFLKLKINPTYLSVLL